ncbi:MAG: hypothetical protein WCK96_02735 [Methylococcales bacterium]
MPFLKALKNIEPFLSSGQFTAMKANCLGEEKDFFIQEIIDLEKRIDSMPVTYQQDGMGDNAIVYLHYFTSNYDCYITEKDMDGGVNQAFGYAMFKNAIEFAELGYISIEEITECGAQLDLYFLPCTLSEVKQTIKAKTHGHNQTTIIFLTT